MPNLNAALACAQLEKLDLYVENKRELSDLYYEFLKENKLLELLRETKNTRANYWLNAVVLKDKTERDNFLTFTNENDIMTRPIWGLMNKLEMFKDCPHAELSNAEWLEDRVVNITSSVRL